MFVGGNKIYTVYGKEAVIINSAVHMFFVLSVSRLASELFLNFRNMKTAVINFIMHTFTILLILLAFLYFSESYQSCELSLNVPLTLTHLITTWPFNLYSLTRAHQYSH